MEGSQIFAWENQTWLFPTPDTNSKSNLRPKAMGIMSDQTLDVGLSKNKKRGRRSRGGSGSGGGSCEVEKGGGGCEKKSDSGGDNVKGDDESDNDHESEIEMHAWTEKQRRKKMKSMYDELQVLIPQLPPKADKATIVTETVNHIKALQQTLQELERQKLQKLQGSAAFAREASASSSSSLSSVLMIAPQKAPAEDSREAFLADLVQLSANDEGNVNINSSGGKSNMYPVAFQTWTSSNVVLNVFGNDAQISVCSEIDKPGILTDIARVLEQHKIEFVSAQVSPLASNRRMYLIQAQLMNRACDGSTEGFEVGEIYRQAANELLVLISSC